ncbi:MAG: hypothetical protein ACI85I_002000 [Arenicella sp.]|jgi:hypothetical protein
MEMLRKQNDELKKALNALNEGLFVGKLAVL